MVSGYPARSRGQIYRFFGFHRSFFRIVTKFHPFHPGFLPRRNAATGLTTIWGENAVSPDKNFWTNYVTGRKCS